MNPQMQTQAQPELSTYADTTMNDTDLLAGWGFDPHEIASLLWLRQWYQNGGSDRATMVRHLEFLRLLWRRGELELYLSMLIHDQRLCSVVFLFTHVM